MYSPLNVTPFGAAQNQKGHYSNKRGISETSAKSTLPLPLQWQWHCRNYAKLLCQTQRDFVGLVLFHYPYFCLPTYHVHMWKLHIQPRVQLQLCAKLWHTWAKDRLQWDPHRAVVVALQKHSGVTAGPCEKRELRLHDRDAWYRVKRLEIAGWLWSQLRLAWGCSEQKIGLDEVSHKRERKS